MSSRSHSRWVTVVLVAGALVISACAGTPPTEQAAQVVAEADAQAPVATTPAETPAVVPPTAETALVEGEAATPRPVAATPAPEASNVESAAPAEPAAEPTPVPPTSAAAPTAVPTAVSAPPTPEPAPILVPELTGQFGTIDGGQIDLGSLQGQDVVLWFWAPW